jgi:hypothetical protein
MQRPTWTPRRTQAEYSVAAAAVAAAVAAVARGTAARLAQAELRAAALAEPRPVVQEGRCRLAQVVPADVLRVAQAVRAVAAWVELWTRGKPVESPSAQVVRVEPVVSSKLEVSRVGRVEAAVWTLAELS